MPSNNTIFVIAVIVIIVLLFYLFDTGAIHNEGNLQFKKSARYNKQQPGNESDNESNESNSDSDSNSDQSQSQSQMSGCRASVSGDAVSIRDANMDDSVDSSLEIIKERAMGMNGPYFRRRSGGKYKHDSYIALGAGDSLKNIDRQFKVSDVTKNYTDRYVPVAESDELGAPINIINNKGTENDKYNVNSYLPQEKEKDWFETIETVDVKNSHLINIYRPIGADTIGSTHKNSSYDLRGNDKAVCPKFVVAPWLQSSIEPDRSTKSLCA
jgi:hypothetical protein